MSQKVQISAEGLFNKLVDIAGEATKAANESVTLTKVHNQQILDIKDDLKSVDNNSRERDENNKKYLAEKIDHAADNIKAYLAQELSTFRAGMHARIDESISGPKKVTDFISNAWVICGAIVVFAAGVVGFIIQIKDGL